VLDQHHGDECEVIGGGHRGHDEDLGDQPIAAFDRSGEDAFDKAICARIGEKCGRRAGPNAERHEEVRDNAVAVEPGVLRAHGRHAADGKENDADADQGEAAANGSSEFLDV